VSRGVAAQYNSDFETQQQTIRRTPFDTQPLAIDNFGDSRRWQRSMANKLNQGRDVMVLRKFGIK
jgi:hypothetical protein